MVGLLDLPASGSGVGSRRPWTSNLTPQLCGMDRSRDLSELPSSQLHNGGYDTFKKLP